MNVIKNLEESRIKLNDSMSFLEDYIKSLSESKTAEQIASEKKALKSLLKNLIFVDDNLKLAVDFTYFGQRSGGQVKSAAKTKAVRENGKKGGRPSKKIILRVEKVSDSQRSEYIVFFDDNSSVKVPGNLSEVLKRYPNSRYKWSDAAYEAVTISEQN